jgi:undecaprenyl-diphosphatase
VLGIEEAGITFEVFVHFGTVLSILTVYGRDVLDLLQEAGSALADPGGIPERNAENDTFRLGVFILITLIPTGVIYVLFKEPLEAAFGDPRLASGMLFVTGILLLLTLLRPNPKGRLSSLKAFVVGIAQSAAMIPGISRSGSTICVALYQNVKPEQAANFSFLMLLPVVLGATLLKGLELVEQGATVTWLPLLLGTLIAYVSGVVAIKLMIDFVKRGNLQYFAYYCFLIGGFGLWLL